MSWESKRPTVRKCMLVLGIAFTICGLRPITADDGAEPPAGREPLVVRDVAVYLLSAYGTQLNERGLFASTLPGYTLSRRPTASRDSSNEPTPAGIITFSGPPEKNVDVLLEFDNGRFLSHWPPGRMRSKRLLWAGMDLSTRPPDDASKTSEDHWLLPLRDADRLYAAGNKHNDRFLLYDAELPYSPHVTLQRAEGGYTVTNTGQFVIHDVVIYRPAAIGRWEVAAAAEVGAAKKASEKGDGEEKPASSPAQSGDKPSQQAQPQPTSAPAAVAVEAAADAADDAVAVEAVAEQADAFAAEAQPVPGEKSKESETQPEQKPAAGTSAPASLVGTLTADEAIKSWRQSLAALNLEQPEIQFVLGILRQQALRTDSAMLVYRLDEVQLEKLLPLDVTPYPDRLFRVALVIVQDADPDLQSQIETLVAQLGDDEWRQREQAQKELTELGLAAKPKLETALKHKDAEIVFRAEQLLEAIKAKQ